MGTLIDFHPTKRSLLRGAKREMAEMFRRSAGGQDPIPSHESRELFEMGLVEEIKWLDWETYCLSVLNRIFDGG